MNFKYLLLSIIFLAPFASAEITDKKFLNEIFIGCNDEPVDWLTAGQSFEYCGCIVNKVSQELNMADVIKMGAEYTLDGDDLSPFLNNKKLVEAARKVGASAVAHGCTGKGNDQVRFDASV